MDRYNQLLSILFQILGKSEIKSQEDIDAVLLFCKNVDNMHLHVCVSRMYDQIIEYAKTNKDEYKLMVITLCKYYIMNCPRENDLVLEILRNCDFQTAPDIFLKSQPFGNSLLRSFIRNLSLKEDYLVKNSNNYPLLMKYIDKLGINFLNDYIRVMLRTINSVFSNTDTTFQFFSDVIYNNVKFDDETLNKTVIFLKDYYPFVIRLIYCDVYELLTVMNFDNPKALRLKAYIEMMVGNHDYSLHTEYTQENNAIFALFYQCDDLQRAKNRAHLNVQQKKDLQAIYPLYGVDAASMIHGR